MNNEIKDNIKIMHHYQLQMMMDASIYHYIIIDDDDADDGCIYISLYHYFNGWMMDASIISINYQLSLMDADEWADADDGCINYFTRAPQVITHSAPASQEYLSITR